MYSFGHQGTSLEGEHYYNSNHYAPSWNGNQNQYNDQYYYDEGYHYEGYQHENFDPQEYQAMPQDTAEVSNMEIMLYNFLQQQEKREQEKQTKIDHLQKMVGQLQIQQGLLREKLEQQAIAVAAAEKIMNEEVEMEMASHQEIQVYEAGIYSNILSVAVGGELDMSVPSELGVETEHYVESKEESYEDLADVYPCLIQEDPQENSSVIVNGGCEVWEPEFPTIEYTRGTLAGGGYEDVYLATSPPDKFRQFSPYILALPERRSHDPFVLEEAYILKGSRPYFHFILHGRRFKWDLKVD